MPRRQEIQFEQPSDILVFINKYLTILIGLIVLVVLLTGYWLFLSPKILKIQDINLSNTQYVDEQQRDETLVKDLEQLKGKYQNILVSRQGDLEKLQNMFPDQPQYAELFVMAEQLAARRGFKLREVQFTEAEPSAEQASVLEEIRPDTASGEDASFQIPQSSAKKFDLKSIVIQMQVYTPADLTPKVPLGEPVETLGHYDSFKLFLDDMERNLRLMDIQTVSFDAQEEDPKVSETFDMSIITYYRD